MKDTRCCSLNYSIFITQAGRSGPEHVLRPRPGWTSCPLVVTWRESISKRSNPRGKDGRATFRAQDTLTETHSLQSLVSCRCSCTANSTLKADRWPLTPLHQTLHSYSFRTAGHQLFERGIMSQALYDKCHIWSVGGVYTHIHSCVPTQREFPVIASLTKQLIRLSL